MKKVEAVIRKDKLEDLKNAISSANLTKGMTVNQVLGYGSQKGFAEYVRGQKITPTLLAKIRVSFVVADEVVDDLVDLIMTSVRTGEVGDGKIFVIPVEEVYRIRTRETGNDAL